MSLHDRGPFRRVSIKRYVSQMSTPNPKGVFDPFVAEILEQQGFCWEEDPRSIYDPQQLYDALERYATDWGHFEHLDKHLYYGLSMAFKIFAKPKSAGCLPVLSDTQVARKALKLKKSSGLPLMVTKGEALTYSFNRESQVRLGLKAPNPCIAYKRTQKGNKTRLVWGYPLEMTIMEARFARPLIDLFLSRTTPMAFGLTKCELGAKLHRYFEDEPGVSICLDYSKYDSTISATLIKHAFRILSTWFSEADREEFGWKTILRYFIWTPIVMPDGHLYTGKNHGVPSGSYFTQLIDSIINVALCYALKSRFGLDFTAKQLFVLGDDVILQQRGRFQLSEMAAYLATFGLHLHDDKKTVVGQVHFLGAVWTKGKPDAPIVELATKAIFPEQFRKYGESTYCDAEEVLRSYASNYKSGFNFIPRGDHSLDIWRMDKPRLGVKTKTEFLSGSDKFLEEEYALIRGPKQYESCISMRYLL